MLIYILVFFLLCSLCIFLLYVLVSDLIKLNDSEAGMLEKEACNFFPKAKPKPPLKYAINVECKRNE